MLTLGLHGICFQESWGIAQPLTVCTLPFSRPKHSGKACTRLVLVVNHMGFGVQRLGPDGVVGAG